jgi:ATP/maltotriose-dependent transcriptional regulator MalT
MSSKMSAVERKERYEEEYRKFVEEMKMKEFAMRKQLQVYGKDARKEIQASKRKRWIEIGKIVESYFPNITDDELMKLIDFLKGQESRGGFVSKALGRPCFKQDENGNQEG